jgi:putative tricarboxylic transport membrane protein
MSEISSQHKKRVIPGMGETVFTVLLPLFSIFFIWGSTQVSEPYRSIAVGPRTFPLLIGWMMLATSIVLVWQRLRTVAARVFATASDPQMTLVPLEENETSISDWPAVWIVIGSLLALCLLLERLGFVATISLFLFGLSTLFGPRRWSLNLLVSLAFSSLFYYLFTSVLGIPLPNGVLSFLF